MSGDDFWRKGRKWVHKQQIVDRKNNQYTKFITDPGTGKVIHHCEEPLTEHHSHGSAKKKDKPKAG